MFKISLSALTLFFGTFLLVDYYKSTDAQTPYPTNIGYMEDFNEVVDIDFPFNFFAGEFIFLDKQRNSSDSNATAFSVSSSQGYWLTAAHAVKDCWGVLIDKDGVDWVFVDDVILHPNADLALLKTPLSAPSLISISKDSWIPKNGYVVGYSGNRINFANIEVIGWTKAYDDNENYVFDVILWKPEVLMDQNRTFGLSGSPIMDYNNNVVGVMVAIDKRGYFASVPTYFLDSMLKTHGVELKKLEVPVERTKNVEDFAKDIHKFEKQGSVKRIMCVRKPTDDMKTIAGSYQQSE